MAYLNPGTRTRERVGPMWVVRFGPMRVVEETPPGEGGMGGTPFDVPSSHPNYSIRRGDTLAVRFIQLGDIVNWTKVWYTAKTRYGDADADSQIQVTIDDLGAGGLEVLNGAASTPEWGLLEVDVAVGAVTLRLSSDATSPHLAGERMLYDVQVQNDVGIRTVITGYFDVVPDITLAI